MGYTTKSAMRHAAEQFEKLKAPVQGVVANRVRAKERPYYPGYGYGPTRSGTSGKVAVRDLDLQEVDENGHEVDAPAWSESEPR